MKCDSCGKEKKASELYYNGKYKNGYLNVLDKMRKMIVCQDCLDRENSGE